MTNRPLAFMPNQWKMKGHSQIKHFLRCDKQKKRQPAINGRRFTMPARDFSPSRAFFAAGICVSGDYAIPAE
jgi:hypothetical protein